MTARTAKLRLPSGATLLVLGLVLSACAGLGKSSGSTPPADTEVPAKSVAADTASLDYDGRHRSDERLGPARRELEAAADAHTKELTAAGWGFPADRGPLLRIHDDVPREEAVRVRSVLHAGRRRPLVAVSPAALLAGEVDSEIALRVALAEAALIARAGDRALPPEVVAGAPLVLADAVLEVALISVLQAKSPSLRAERVYAGRVGERLAAAVRLGAVERIGLGERPLTRYLDAILDGAGEGAALAEIGVDDTTFLAAAAETDRERLLTDLLLDPALAELVDLRRALYDGGPEATEGLLEPVTERLDDELDPRVAADARLAVAEVYAAGGDLVRAHSHLRKALATPEDLIRRQDARRLELVLAEGGARHAELALRFLQDYPADPAGQEALDALGFGPEVSAPVRALSVDILSTRPADRARAAEALGRIDGPDALEVLERLSSDAAPSVRAAALTALAVRRPKGVADRLARALQDSDPKVRLAALEGLLSVDPARGERAARELAGVPDPPPKPAASPEKPSKPSTPTTTRTPSVTETTTGPRTSTPAKPPVPPKPMKSTDTTSPSSAERTTPPPSKPPKPEATKRPATPPKPTPTRTRPPAPTPPKPVQPRTRPPAPTPPKPARSETGTESGDRPTPPRPVTPPKRGEPEKTPPRPTPTPPPKRDVDETEPPKPVVPPRPPKPLPPPRPAER